MDDLRVCAIQTEHADTLARNLAAAEDAVARAAEGGAALALLPEYFFAVFPGGPPSAAPDAERIRAMMARASAKYGIAVAGNVIESRGSGFVNLGVGYERGVCVLSQEKVHPMPREAASGVVGGPGLRTFTLGGVRTGMLVCADILFPEAAGVLASQGAQLLLNPVMSPWRADDDGREARVAMYVARAYDAGAFVLKAAGFLHEKIAGRSLVTAPWGVLARARGDFEAELLFADLDLARLTLFREHKAGFPVRRPEAYRDPPQ